MLIKKTVAYERHQVSKFTIVDLNGLQKQGSRVLNIASGEASRRVRSLATLSLYRVIVPCGVLHI